MKHDCQSWATWFKKAKQATMYSCPLLQSINTSVKWNCTMNAIIFISACASLRKKIAGLGSSCFTWTSNEITQCREALWEHAIRRRFFIMALNLCLLFSTWNATPNHERHDSTRKNKATMYSCYSSANNQYKCLMELHNEHNHGISACPSLRKITADLSWSFFIWRSNEISQRR